MNIFEKFIHIVFSETKFWDSKLLQITITDYGHELSSVQIKKFLEASDLRRVCKAMEGKLDAYSNQV